MAKLEYTCFDNLLPADNPITIEINYNVNLFNTVIDGINLVLCDDRENGCIKGNNMGVSHYNHNGRRVSISTARDHQLTGTRLYTGVSISKSNEGLVELIWNQCAEVKSQKNSIISNFQVRSHGYLVSDVNIAHGGKQTITTPNGIIFKGGLPYIERYYPTDTQMRDVKQEEIMTSPGECNSSLLDDSTNALEQRLKQFSPTSIDATDNFYNMEENIIVQKSNIDDNSIISDASSTSTSSRRQSYHARTRKEK